MKIFNKDLRQGLKLIRKKRYAKAIRFLEPKVPIFREDQTFYYLLAHACFHSSDLGGAKFYLERGILLDPENLELKQLLALVHLRRKDSTAAAKVWLAMLERDPDHRRARRGLEKLRKIDDPAKMKEILDKKNYMGLLPSLGQNWAPIILIGSFALLLVAASIVFLPILFDKLGESNDDVREELQYLDMELRGHSHTDNNGSFHYILTPQEVEHHFNLAIQYFNDYKDNLSQREINRLNNSNSSQEIKAKIAILEGHLRKPDYLGFYTDYSYRQVLEEPWLYLGCYILWTGKVSNLEILSDRINFLFLVGFENESQLEGVIPCYMESAANLDPDLPVELMGRIELENGQLQLKVETIRHIIVE